MTTRCCRCSTRIIFTIGPWPPHRRRRRRPRCTKRWKGCDRRARLPHLRPRRLRQQRTPHRQSCAAPLHRRRTLRHFRTRTTGHRLHLLICRAVARQLSPPRRSKHDAAVAPSSSARAAMPATTAAILAPPITIAVIFVAHRMQRRHHRLVAESQRFQRHRGLRAAREAMQRLVGSHLSSRHLEDHFRRRFGSTI